MKGRCATCVAWDDYAARKYRKWKKTAEPNSKFFMEGECTKILEEVDIVIYGDGRLESIDTNAYFGCTLWEARPDPPADDERPS